MFLKFSNLFLSRSQKASSIIKNLEAVVQEFVEYFAKSLKSRRYAKIHKTNKKTPEIEFLF